MSQCEYAKYRLTVAEACEQYGKGHMTPLEVLSIIQLIYTDAPPSRCLICQVMTYVDLRTGNFVVKGKSNCQMINNP